MRECNIAKVEGNTYLKTKCCYFTIYGFRYMFQMLESKTDIAIESKANTIFATHCLITLL